MVDLIDRSGSLVCMISAQWRGLMIKRWAIKSLTNAFVGDKTFDGSGKKCGGLVLSDGN